MRTVGLDNFQSRQADPRRVKPYRSAFMMATYNNNLFFYSTRNRLELTGDNATIVKYYKGDLNDSFYTKWEWFKNLPTVIKFITEND